MLHAFRDRPINSFELEELRLILSSFRDGSGQVVLKSSGQTMPGFRDYERSLAAVLNASAPENKGIFDVLVPVDGARPFGISCKMTSFRPPRHQSSFMELSNSAAKFRKRLLDHQINWATEPMLAGPAIVDLVSEWHYALADEVDVPSSRYSILAHDKKWQQFQILCYPLNLKQADPRGEVDWVHAGAALQGNIDLDGRRHRLWECYLNSGGQLKYYPPLAWAEWTTGRFTLEEAPPELLRKRAQSYFGDRWPS